MKHRLCIAISLPESTLSEISALQAKLGRLSLPMSWVKLDKIILQVNLLGRVEDKDIGAVKRLINETCKSYTGFSLAPVFLQALYSRHDPAEIYLSVGGNTEVLSSLQKTLSTALTEIEIPQPHRYDPQIVIGHVDHVDPTTTKQVIDKINDYDFTPLPSFEVESLSLYELFVSKAGTHYQKVGNFVLQSSVQ